MPKDKRLLLDRTYLITPKEAFGDRLTWYTPTEHLQRIYPSVVRTELMDTTSSCGDWSGFLLQKLGKKVYAIRFSQWNNYPRDSFALRTDSEPFLEFSAKTLEDKNAFELIKSNYNLKCLN